MKMFRFRKAQTRIALSGALVAMLFLTLLALLMRSTIRGLTLAETDEELRTSCPSPSAPTSSFRESSRSIMQRWTRGRRRVQPARVPPGEPFGDSFRGTQVIAKSGDLAVLHSPAALIRLQQHNEIPFTEVEPFSGRARLSRLRVLHLGGKAAGTTLVVFRSIAGPRSVFWNGWTPAWSPS